MTQIAVELTGSEESAEESVIVSREDPVWRRELYINPMLTGNSDRQVSGHLCQCGKIETIRKRVMSYFVRRMTLEDIPQVAEIDREAFPTDWPPPSFKREIQSHMVRYLVAVEKNDRNVTDGLAEASSRSVWGGLFSRVGDLLSKRQSSGNGARDKIVGYVAMWLMVDESHLTSIAVRKSYQRHGVGELLLLSIAKLSVQMKAQVLTLETRVSNAPAQALYEKYGFKKVGLRRRYYSDNREDAIIMTTDSLTSAPYRAKLLDLERKYCERYGALKLSFELVDLPVR